MKLRVWDYNEKKMHFQINAWRMQDPNGFPPSVLVPDGRAEKRLSNFHTMIGIVGLKDDQGNEVYQEDVLEFPNGQRWIVMGYSIFGVELLLLDERLWTDFREQNQHKPTVTTLLELSGYSSVSSFKIVGNIFEVEGLVPENFLEKRANYD